LSPDNAREVLSKLQANVPVQKLPDDVENHTIPDGPDGKDVSITIVRPANSRHEILPVVMYIHGGGWVLGGFDTHERLVRELANKGNVAIVFVNYTLSPEAKISYCPGAGVCCYKMGYSKCPIYQFRSVTYSSSWG
jgi:acetyl esterase/lipase